MAIPNHPSNIKPYMAAMLFDQTHMPTLGRRNMGLGSAFFPSGSRPPMHMMNRLYPSMAAHGASNSPFGAGQYPYPHDPVVPSPWAMQPPPMMGPGFPGPSPGGMPPLPPPPPFMPGPTMGPPGAGMFPPGMMGGGGPGFGGPMAPPMGGLPMGGLPPGMGGTPDFGSMSFPTPSYAGSSVFSSSDGDYDDDDSSSGLWGPDPDEDDPLVYFHRASKKGTRKGKNKAHPMRYGWQVDLPFDFTFGRLPDKSWKKTWGW
ncbi:hypothetical protein CB0940_03476 [Cercospora beticola]|uniref:Uncharacterized protein n=1 Tax=Cercospora beticola TaxID=122368 RepID=A0A2G5I574_CERBT|nr:hypothetical protein CB0940_03476 [Cercospora beticola]PIA99956.1 hypothetical protein CB0940_03476 [Cercospora beticola]WPB00651.1 hypothetical protein RHO25_005271 [Cercospora beticola]